MQLSALSITLRLSVAASLLLSCASGSIARIEAHHALRVVRRPPLPSKPALVQRGVAGHKVSVVLRNTPIRAALQIIFRRSNKSYVLGPGVGGTVTANFVRLSFADALKEALLANSEKLTSTLKGNVYVIKPVAPVRSKATRLGKNIVIHYQGAANRRRNTNQARNYYRGGNANQRGNPNLNGRYPRRYVRPIYRPRAYPYRAAP